MSAPGRAGADVEDAVAARLVDVTFTYPRSAEPALAGVTAEIGLRDFVGVVGPNGGGKTTLLQLLLGLVEPESGEIEVLGRSPARARRRVGYVPQHAFIDPSVPATVLDVVLMGRLAASSWGPRFGSDQIAAARGALERTATADLADRPIATLSGGQRQRVLIARALASEVELLLLDEPTTGVDLHREKELLDLLTRLNERLPIVMVSHDVAMVSSHMKQVLWVNRRVESRPAAELTLASLDRLYHRGGGHEAAQ